MNPSQEDIDALMDAVTEERRRKTWNEFLFDLAVITFSVTVLFVSLFFIIDAVVRRLV